MSRPGGVPQSLRGIPSGFAQQPPPQQTRSVSNRLPNGKLGNNASGWALGSGVPLYGGGGGLQNPPRQQTMSGNVSFAQSLGGSQPATPLDLAEFPSLSNSSQLANSAQSSLWSSAAGSRTASGQAVQRGANTPLPSQQQPQQQQSQHDELFGSSSRMSSAQGSFRFGSNQAAAAPGAAPGAGGALGPAAPPTQQNGTDDFPPLNRSATGGTEMSQERSQSLMSSLGFGAQGPGGNGTSNGGAAQAAQAAQASALGGSRGGNGLLNALSANSRVGELRSPVGTRPPQPPRLQAGEEDARQKQATFQGDSRASQSPIGDSGMQTSSREPRALGGAVGLDGAAVSSRKLPAVEDSNGSSADTVAQDLLQGMAPMDRWGMKGLRSLINNYADYSSSLTGFGFDLGSLGVDLGANELLSTQVYSLFDGAAPQLAIPKFRLPECYKVNNVGPIENKITSFNEETLMWIFYSCPNDVKQQLAAIELTNRNWRWHKRQQVWLTKDDLNMPQVLSLNHERGFYIIWDTANWRKERTTREITLNYADLDNTPIAAAAAV